MQWLALSGACAALTGVITVWEAKRMQREHHQRERRAHPVPVDEMIQDCESDFMIAPGGIEQMEPALRELQDAIMAADATRVRGLLAGMGARHPDTMKLDRCLTPLLLAAYMHVRDEEHDRRMHDIMLTLLQRGALITQREETSGATVLHFLASQPAHCSVIHRIRFLLNTLENYRNGSGSVARMPGLMFDPVLNAAPAAGCGGDVVGIAMHLLGMRCRQGKLPEDLSPHGDRRNMLRRRRLLLPLGLQEYDDEGAAAEFN